MQAIRLIKVIVMILMLSAAAGAYYLTPTIKMAEQRKVNLEQIIPQQFYGWKMLPNQHVIELPPELAANLSRIYTETLSRTYINAKGQQVMLSIAYGADQSDGMGVHKPEVCYPAQGFTVGSITQSFFDFGNGKKLELAKLVAKLDGRIEPISYWIMLGEHNVNNARKAKIEQIKYGLHGVIPDGMLVRVSSIDSDVEKGYELQSQFIGELYMSVRDNEREIIFGGR